MWRTVSAIEAEIGAAQGPRVCLPNRPFRAIGVATWDDPRYFPGWAAVFVIAFPANVVDGKEVRFIEPNRAVREFAARRRGRRSAGLLVAPEECAAGP